jgi:hypothetical protein
VTEALGAACDAADGRLLAVRLVLTGNTPLHGPLARDLPGWRAQSLARGQIIGGDRVWVEELELGTAPIYDLKQLAERDDLTRILLDGLDEAETLASGHALKAPTAVRDLLGILPGEIRTELEDALGAEQRTALLGEVRALLLESLRHSGGASGSDWRGGWTRDGNGEPGGGRRDDSGGSP